MGKDEVQWRVRMGWAAISMQRSKQYGNCKKLRRVYRELQGCDTDVGTFIAASRAWYTGSMRAAVRILVTDMSRMW